MRPRLPSPATEDCIGVITLFALLFIFLHF